MPSPIRLGQRPSASSAGFLARFKLRVLDKNCLCGSQTHPRIELVTHLNQTLLDGPHGGQYVRCAHRTHVADAEVPVFDGWMQAASQDDSRLLAGVPK